MNYLKDKLFFNFAVFLFLCLSTIGFTAGSFHFTVTADSRAASANFQHLLSEMKTLVGAEGVFHISAGDIDPLGGNYTDIVNTFGDDTIWYPVVGNHEAETPADMDWVRDHYNNAVPHLAAPDSGVPLPYIVNVGPAGCESTTYSFDYANSHFIVINEYYDGTSDTGTDGDVVDVLYDWLSADLSANNRSAIFVIGHEPAFPFCRHTSDSLNKYPANRDRFWNLLESYGANAYFCGHTHWYSKYKDNGRAVWQIDVGNCGNESTSSECGSGSTDGGTFLDVVVSEDQVQFNTYRGDFPNGQFSLYETWHVSITPLAAEPPVAYDDTYKTMTGTTLTVNAPGVLKNDYDANFDPLTAILVAVPSNGSLSFFQDGSFDYTPQNDFSGTDSFTYIANDGSTDSIISTVTISVSDESTIHFKQNSDGYSGTLDTLLEENSPGTSYATSTSLTIDSDEPSGTGKSTNGLLWFQNIIGTGPVQIPPGPGVEIVSATLTLNTTNPGNGASLHRMLNEWNDTDTWSTFSNGILADDLEAKASSDLVTGSVASGTTTLDVKNSIQAWINGETNFGWVFLPAGTDGWDFDSSEGTSAPLLTVTYRVNNPPAAPANLTATSEPGSIELDWDNNIESDLAGYNVCRSTVSGSGYTLLNEDDSSLLTPFTTGTSTGEKPQSKVWYHDNTWWCVVPDNTTGTWIWRLDGTSWTKVLQLSSKTSIKADCKPLGDITHILLFDGVSTQLASVEYISGTPGAYDFWSARPELVNITLSDGVEIATIDIDSTGRMWLASDVVTDVEVRYSDSPYTTWSGPVILESGLYSDDICVIKALPDSSVGVLWSNQATKRFGFRVHFDEDDPTAWTTDEIPASQSALDSIGSGMSDDHLNIAVTSNGTLYAAVKTSYDTIGYPKIALLVRRWSEGSGSWTWDDLYEIDDSGTRPIVVLNERLGRLLVIYTASEGYHNIVYKESPIPVINFSDRKILIEGALNNVTSTKQNFQSDLVVLATSSTEAEGIHMTFAKNSDPLLNTYTDVSALPGNTYYYVVRALDNIGQESPDSNEGSATASQPAASDLTATTVSLSEIDLGWNDNVSDGSGFSIERSLNGIAWTEIASVAPGTTSYNDTGLSAYTTYLYRIKSLNYPGFSNVADNTTVIFNAHPVANPDSYTVVEDQTLSIAASGVLGNDNDPEGDPLTAILVNNVTDGTLTLVYDGSFTYTPDTNFNGSDSFTYKANDGTSNSLPTTVTITITAANDSPVANADNASTSRDVPVNIDVLANDTDPEGDTLSVNSVTQPANGSVFNNGTDVTYTPSQGYIGDATFTYTASDGNSGVSNQATVSITVNPPAPVTLFSDGFESGDITAGGWTSSGSVIVKGPSAYEGLYGVQAGGTAWIVKSVSTVGFNDIHVKYARKTKGLDSGEFLTVEWSADGTNWTTVESTQDTTWKYQDIDLSGVTGAGENDALSLRFSTNANKTNEYASIDNVEITGVTSGPDLSAPIPDRMTWAIPPHATGSTSISMTATTASDPSGVEYYFTCTAVNGHDSSWQDSPTYEDTGLSPSTEYTYTVIARDKSANQNETGASEPQSATPVDIPPAAPTGLAATPGDGQVNLDWNNNSETDLAGYNVYRSTVPGGTYTKINSTLLTVSDYLDLTVTNGTAYFYVVTAVDSVLNESDYSNEVSATPGNLQAVYVIAINMSSGRTGKNIKASAAITINKNQSGATIHGDWLFNGAVIQSDATGLTDNSGQTVIVSPPKKAKTGDTFKFVVTDVVLSGYLFDPTQGITENSIGI